MRSALRVATLDEVARYGSRGGHKALRARGLLPPIMGAAGYTLIQHNEVTAGTSIQYASNVANGNLLVLILGTGGAAPWSGIGDSGDTITTLGTFHAPNLNDTMNAYATVTSKGGTRVTWSWTGAVGESAWIGEFSGADTSVVQDGTLVGNDWSATAPYTINLPTLTAAAGSLVVNAEFTEGTTTSFTAPWTQIVIDSNGNGWSYIGSATAGTQTPAANVTGAGTAAAISIAFAIKAPAAASASAVFPVFLPRNTLARGVRNLGQMALYRARAPKLATAAPGGGAFTAADTSLSSDTAVRVELEPRTAADTSLSSDSASRVQTFARTASDTNLSSDMATRTAMAFARAGSDTSTSSDAATRVEAEPRTGSDTSTSSDSATRVLRVPRTGSDTSTSSDTATRVESEPRTGGDTSLSSDSASTGSGGGSRTASDTSLSSDTAVRVLGLPRTAADTSTLSDAATRTLALPRSSTDTSTSADVAVRVLRMPRSASDSSASSDTATRGIVRPRTAADTTLSSDSATRLSRVSLTANDTSLSSDRAVSSSTGGAVFKALAGLVSPFQRTGVTHPAQRTGQTSPSQKKAQD